MPEGVGGTGAVSWDQLRAMAARGHEIADHIHGYAPAAGDWEKQMRASRDWIDREVPGQRCLTHAYGGCDFNATRAAAKVFIAARRCVGLEHAEPGDLYAAKGRLVDGVTREQFADMLTDAIQYRGWFTTGLHATPTPDVLKGMLEAIQSKRNDLWVTPYRDVVKYIRERRFTDIAVTSRENEIRIATSSPLPVDIYNQLLTLAVPLPEKHGPVSVAQDGKAVHAQLRDAEGVVFCDVIPGGGEIVVRF